MNNSPERSAMVLSSTQAEPMNEDIEGDVTQPGDVGTETAPVASRRSPSCESSDNGSDHIEPQDRSTGPESPLGEHAVANVAQIEKLADNDHDVEDEQQVGPQPLKEDWSDLSTLDWVALQSRFEADMKKQTEEENKLRDEFRDLTSLYLDWTAVSAIREEQRAAKRLRTRVAYVQHEEGVLRAKEEHLERVRAAFQNAMSMLDT